MDHSRSLLPQSNNNASEQTSLALPNGIRKASYGSTSNQDFKQSTVIIEHVISPHDTLQGVALRYGVTIENLKRHNKIWAREMLIIGSVLRVPINKVKYDQENIHETVKNNKPSEENEVKKDREKAVNSRCHVCSNPPLDGMADLLSKVDHQLEVCKKFNVKMERNLNDPVRRSQENFGEVELPWKPMQKIRSATQVYQQTDDYIDSDTDEMQGALA